MSLTIHTIPVPLLLGFKVNCYLVQVDDGFILIDTGTTARRITLDAAFHAAGCTPGTLKLIILTHGDFDHCGNAAYLREKFGCPVVMHEGDLGMVEQGDMYYNRQPNPIMRAIMGRFLKLAPAERFTPDRIIAEDDDLAAYGLDARVIHLPGHSLGSIGILAAEGDLFIGDLLGSMGRKPALWMIDDQTAAAASVAKLRDLPITTVYPGHGKPFAIEEFWDAM